MAATTIKVETEVRDELAHVAADDLGGVTLNAALAHLLTEHRKAAVLAAYSRLQADPAAWADYQGELDEWDGVAGDGMAGDRLAGDGPNGAGPHADSPGRTA